MRTLFSLPAAALLLALTSCGGSQSNPQAQPNTVFSNRPTRRIETCGENDKVHQHELDQHATGETEALVPCSSSGKHDFAGLVHIESEPNGLHIHIEATDDDVSLGVLGAEVKARDAVVVYPKGRGSKSVEVPLVKTEHGYRGDMVIPYAELDKLTDDGTKVEVAIFDHDQKGGGETEEMHVAIAVSTGKSCEKAIDENPQTVEMGKKPGSAPDLTDAQLGAPMKTSAFFSHCNLKDDENAEICVAVKNGKPLGVSVAVSPADKRAAACIDKAVRKLRFPSSDKLDVVHQKF